MGLREVEECRLWPFYLASSSGPHSLFLLFFPVPDLACVVYHATPPHDPPPPLFSFFYALVVVFCVLESIFRGRRARSCVAWQRAAQEAAPLEEFGERSSFVLEGAGEMRWKRGVEKVTSIYSLSHPSP